MKKMPGDLLRPETKEECYGMDCDKCWHEHTTWKCSWRTGKEVSKVLGKYDPKKGEKNGKRQTADNQA